MLGKPAGGDDAKLANNPGSFNLNVPTLVSRILQPAFTFLYVNNPPVWQQAFYVPLLLNEFIQVTPRFDPAHL
jgi:hypothetical protein